MRGTRYGDFSRFITGLRTRQTAALLMQQGRVQLDADWNAQAELADWRLSGAIADILGASGAPAADPGFEVRPRERLEFSGHGAILTRRRLTLGRPGAVSFTIEMRVRWAGGAGTLIDLADERGHRGQLRLAVRDDGTLVFSQHARGAAEPSAHPDLASREPLPAGTDAHVAVVCRDGEAAIWVDSRPGSARPARIAPSEERLVVIGAAAGPRGRGHGQHFTGVIGDVRIWHTARRDRELGAPLPGDSPPPRELLAWWPLDGPAAAGLRERVSGELAMPEGAPPPHWRLAGLEVSPGRYYVAGHMVRRDEPLLLPARLPDAGMGAGTGHHIVYLEVWEDSVPATEDPALSEPALGGLDSVVAAELAVNVGWVAVPRPWDRDPGELLGAALHAAGQVTTGELAADHRGPPVTGNWLYRVEVHQGGHSDPGITEIEVTVDAGGATVTLAEAWTGHGLAGVEAEFLGVAPDGQEVTVRHAVEPAGEPAGGPADGAPGWRTLRVTGGTAHLAAFRNLRLRRPAPQPTFKWSRRNGADTIAVHAVEDRPGLFQLAAGSLPATALAPGQAVELLRGPAAGAAGRPAAIRHIVTVDPDNQRITLDQDLPGVGARLAWLRLWDQAPGTSAPDGAVPLTTGEWIELEHGVSVRFRPGHYRAGDYWWVPVRQDGAPVLWDRRDGHPQFRRPDGIERCQAPLALVAAGDQVRVRDLRGMLRPVVRPSAFEAEPGDPEPEPARPPFPGSLEGSPPWTGTVDPGEGAGGEPDEDEDEAPSIPPGFALLGPADGAAPGWRPTSVEVATRRAWRPPVALPFPEPPLPVALVPAGGGLLLITATDIWTVDPGSGEVAHRAALPEPRAGFACAAIGDTILLLGGRRQGAERPDGRVLSFDASRGSWLAGRQPLISAVDGPAVAVAAVGDDPSGGTGRVHLLGGAGRWGGWPSRAHQVYDPAGDRWTQGTPLEHPRKGAAAGTAAGAIYLFGGTTRRGGGGEAPPAVYDESARTWSAGPPLPATGAVAVSAVPAAAGGQLIAATAPSPGQALRIAALDAAAGAWADLPCPPRPVRSAAMALHEDRLFLAGVDGTGQVVLMTLPPERRWFLFEPRQPLDADW